jgi:hypothetical protein
MTMQEKIKIGFQAFASDGGEEFGAVRQVSPHELVIYVENAGDFTVPLDAVESVHSEKVILNCRKLDSRLRKAIGHAHDQEKPGL